jgi:hypothetical protein
VLTTAVAASLVLGLATHGEPEASAAPDGTAPATTRPVTGPSAVEAPAEPSVSEPVPHVDAPPVAKPPVAEGETRAAVPPPETPTDRYAPWEKRYGGFAEIDLQLTTMDDAFAAVVGGGAGFILVNRVIVGASGYGLVFHDRVYPSMDGDQRLRMAWGGPTIGVYAVRTKRVESSATWLIAGGRACLNFTATDVLCKETTGVFVSQVEVDVYIKFAKIVRLGFGLGYRFVGATDWRGPGDWALAGGYGSIKLALGRF